VAKSDLPLALDLLGNSDERYNAFNETGGAWVKSRLQLNRMTTREEDTGFLNGTRALELSQCTPYPERRVLVHDQVFHRQKSRNVGGGQRPGNKSQHEHGAECVI
jgi:hypothetical protein